MNFLEFIKVFKKVYPKTVSSIALLRKTSLVKNKFAKIMDKQLLWELVITHCYGNIIPIVLPKFQNDTFYDAQTVKEYQDPIIIVREGKENYAFKPEEILQLMHSDLSRSRVTQQINYGVVSLVKSFRLPQNPYTMSPFSLENIKNILSQLVFYKIEIPSIMPEVLVFLQNSEQLYTKLKQNMDAMQKPKDYTKSVKFLDNEVTVFLQKFFTLHGLEFIEFYGVDFDDSNWISITDSIKMENWWKQYF
jgi:hypothetical protein